jgi:beta-galactosidase
MEYLRDIFHRYLGENVVLFTVGMHNLVFFLNILYYKFHLDGAKTGLLARGTVNGAYATVDFGRGANVSQAFVNERQYAPHGPLINTEFYPGWLDLWGHAHSKASTESIVKTFDEMLSVGANVNFYMFHGGTNFGFTSG